jgi:hypothetical protein
MDMSSNDLNFFTALFDPSSVIPNAFDANAELLIFSTLFFIPDSSTNCKKRLQIDA